jgi:hypothetical protein
VEATSTPQNEELLVQYLLGKLPEAKQVEIEDLAFQDWQYLQQLQDVENDLIDEYVRGEIPPEQRVEFERHFLASAERRRKVEFARALATASPEPEKAEVVRPAVTKTRETGKENFLVAFIRRLTPMPAFALTAAALALVVGGIWLLTDRSRLRSQLSDLKAARQADDTKRRELEAQLANEKERSQVLTAQIQQQQKEPDNGAQHQQRESATPTPSSAIVALALLPGLPRGSTNVPKLELTSATGTVRLQVGLDPQDDYQRFRVELNTQQGKLAWSQANLSAHTTRMGRAVILNLPAKTLQAGRYELALKGTNAAGASEDLGYYYFEVVKK